eukprot:gene13806-15877_t
MSAKTTLKEQLDKFRGKKSIDYKDTEIEATANAPHVFVSEVRVTLHHISGSKSFVQSGNECPTIKQAQASAAQELLENTDAAFFCCWENWEASPQTDVESPDRPVSTSPAQEESSASFFKIDEPSSLENTLITSSPRTPNGSKIDAFHYETTSCAPFVSTLTATVLANGRKPSKKLVVVGDPCFTVAQAEISAHHKILQACFTQSYENPATAASRNLQHTLQDSYIDSHVSENELVPIRRQHSDKVVFTSPMPPPSTYLALPPSAPTLSKQVSALSPPPPLPLPRALSERIMSTPSASLFNYSYIIDCLLNTDQKCRVKMWVPENDLDKEMARDVLLIMHTLFPNPELAVEVWTLMDKRYTLPNDEVDDLRKKEAANRTFLVSALCHGGRVLTEVIGGHALPLLSILYHGEPCQALGMIKHRWSSHKLSFEKEGFYKERKAYHYAETYGFNISFGGLGNHYDRDTKIIENVDYAFQHGYFGAGHSMFGLSGTKSVSNGDKLSCVFDKYNSVSGSKSAIPNKLGGLRVTYPGREIPTFQAYCAKFLALSNEEQMYLMLAILTNGLDSEIEQDVLGVKYAAYPQCAGSLAECPL